VPSRSVHVEHSLKRYGIAGEDIHAFIDEPVKVKGGKHREFRHDSETVKLVGKLFGGKYSVEVAENIALDHIMLDHEADIKRDLPISVREQRDAYQAIDELGRLLKKAGGFSMSFVAVCRWLDRASRWNHRRGRFREAINMMGQLTDFLETS
jgi:hypothetical protein